MSAPRPPVPPRQPQREDAAAPAPDPADLGTAYGMELTIGAADHQPAAAETDASDDDADDPLQWIRRWLDRPTGG